MNAFFLTQVLEKIQLNLSSVNKVLADKIENFIATDRLNEILVNIGFKVISVLLVLIIMSIIRRFVKNLIKKAFAVNIERIQKVTGGTERRKETFESLALNIWRYTINILTILWLLSIFVPLD